MDGLAWKEWLDESRVLKKSVGGNICNLIVDTCPSHIEDLNVKESLRRTNTQLNKPPVNSTEKTQAADSFVIQKIKNSWRRNRDKHRLEGFEQRIFR